MQIAILGAGRVGQVLGRRFAWAGHHVWHGVRSPGDVKYAGVVQPRIALTGIPEAVAEATLVVLATPWAAAVSAVAAAGDFAGRVLVDATNPVGGGLILTHGTTDSGAEQVARWAPSARVVKAFNTVGVEVMANPDFDGRRAFLPVCGDDAAACAQVCDLARGIGFDPVRIGALVRARVTEPAAVLWIATAAALGTREFGFGVLERGEERADTTDRLA